ncbi:MAG: hypothetical protein JWQ96_1947 [Segetibacter sp.]|nr:hypothetical protein [Segetibacter sp.]
MYSRQEVSQLKQEFWTIFGQYMLPIPSAEGEKINWVNYKTGKKDIYFKMHTDNRFVHIAIEIAHKDLEIQQLYFEHLQQLSSMFNNSLNEEWEWKLHLTDETGRVVSRVYKELKGVSVINKKDWPALISFFKPRIIALDEFWSSAKYGFEAL